MIPEHEALVRLLTGCLAFGALLGLVWLLLTADWENTNG